MNYKGLFIFTAGVGTGILGTYLFLNKKFTDDLQQYRNELKELYLDKSNKKKEHDEERDKIVNKLNELTTSSKADIVDYTRNYISDEKTESPYEEEERIDQLTSMAEVEHPKEEEPYIITEEEFSDPTPMYDKVTLEYYINDDILIDTMSHEIVNTNDTIGENHIQMITNGEIEDDYLYIRNDIKGTDYEVLVNIGDYEEDEKGYHGIY